MINVLDMLNAEERFWSKVDTSGDCWIWKAGGIRDGYGWFESAALPGEHLAHRVAYRLRHGPIPDGLVICHTCDNRRCVRPDHLWADTQAANMADKKRKGRAWNGWTKPRT